MNLRSRLTALGVHLAGPAGTVVRFLLTAGPGLAGIGLLAYGAWLAWPPAGWMIAGALLLVDRAYQRVRSDRS